MRTKIELVKETKIEKTLYWIKIDGAWSLVFSTLEEARATYDKLLLQDKFLPSVEILDSTVIDI